MAEPSTNVAFPKGRWTRGFMTLACGCKWFGSDLTSEPGDAWTCEEHGSTEVVRVGKVRYV